ncbi:MAG: 2-phosphosulfolactate phosphatase [Solirubrobacterales bacterium]|nr:2-phosphosulfolactate phosphatase [Solirubrobacterales bacterium]
MTIDRTVMIDFLPEAARAVDDGWSVVAVDIMRATTTAVTIVCTGRRCLPVPSLQTALKTASRLDRPLLVGEQGGDLPEGFDLQNSPTALEHRTDLDRPAVLLSSSGTRIFAAAASASAVYAACLRNVTSTVAHLGEYHPRVALIGAGAKGEFRREDQFGCAQLAAGLLDVGYRMQGERTREVTERWRDAPVEEWAGGRSAEYLRRTDQLADLEFVRSRIDDLDAVVAYIDGELKLVRP